MYNYRPKRSFGQGNIFTPVCHSVHRGGVWQGDPPPRLDGGTHTVNDRPVRILLECILVSPCNHCNRIDIEKKLDVLTEIKRSRTVFAHHQDLAVNIIFCITTSVLKNKTMVTGTICVVHVFFKQVGTLPMEIWSEEPICALCHGFITEMYIRVRYMICSHIELLNSLLVKPIVKALFPN